MRDATLFGEHIHVLVDEQCPPEKLVSALNLADTTKIRAIEPSLEDVFVTLTASADQRRVEENLRLKRFELIRQLVTE